MAQPLKIPTPSLWILNSGTDECPKEMLLRASDFCSGFEIIDPAPSSAFRESFCQFGKAPIITNEQLTSSQISNKVFSKRENDVLIRDEISTETSGLKIISIKKTTTRLTFQKKKLMLDRNKNQVGWSCLYERNLTKK